MQFEWRARSWWGVAASAAVHALLLDALLPAATHAPGAPPTTGAVLQVALLAARPAPKATAAAAPSAAAVAPKREAIHYFAPDDVERQLIVLRDPAADQAFALTHPVVLQLFVDRFGRVADIVIAHDQNRPLAARLEAQVRAAFMQLEFLPALRGGKAVPAYLRIELAAQDG